MEENSVELLSRILNEAKEEIYNKEKKTPKKKKSKLLVVFLVISIFLFADCIFLLISNWVDHENLQSQVETLQKRYQTASSARDKYMEQAEAAEDELAIVKLENLDAKLELEFWEENAVFVTESGWKYHRKDCQYVNWEKFWIYNVENAIYKGYSPCSVCDPPTR